MNCRLTDRYSQKPLAVGFLAFTLSPASFCRAVWNALSSSGVPIPRSASSSTSSSNSVSPSILAASNAGDFSPRPTCPSHMPTWPGDQSSRSIWLMSVRAATAAECSQVSHSHTAPSANPARAAHARPPNRLRSPQSSLDMAAFMARTAAALPKRRRASPDCASSARQRDRWELNSGAVLWKLGHLRANAATPAAWSKPVPRALRCCPFPGAGPRRGPHSPPSGALTRLGRSAASRRASGTRDPRTGLCPGSFNFWPRDTGAALHTSLLGARAHQTDKHQAWHRVPRSRIRPRGAEPGRIMNSMTATAKFRFFIEPPKLTRRVAGPPDNKSPPGPDTGAAELGLRRVRWAPPPPARRQPRRSRRRTFHHAAVGGAFVPTAAARETGVLARTVGAKAGDATPGDGDAGALVGAPFAASPVKTSAVRKRFTFGADGDLLCAPMQSPIKRDSKFAAPGQVSADTSAGRQQGRKHVVPTPMASVALTDESDSGAPLKRGCTEQPWHRRPESRHRGRPGAEVGLGSFGSAALETFVLGDDGGPVPLRSSKQRGRSRRPAPACTLKGHLRLGTCEVVQDSRLPDEAQASGSWLESDHHQRGHVPPPLGGGTTPRNSTPRSCRASSVQGLPRTPAGQCTEASPARGPTSPDRRTHFVPVQVRSSPISCGADTRPDPERANVRPSKTEAGKRPASAGANASGTDPASPRGAGADTLDAGPSCASRPSLVSEATLSAREGLPSPGSALSLLSRQSPLLAEDEATRAGLHAEWASALKVRERSAARCVELCSAVRAKLSGEASQSPLDQRLQRMKIRRHAHLW